MPSRDNLKIMIPISHSLLLSTFILFLMPQSSSSSPHNYTPQSTNQTIYDLSKFLCFNCLSNALEFLYTHNLIRLSHWQLPLVWDPQLEAYASWWANQRKSDCRLQHSFPEGGFQLGENIYWGGGSDWRPRDAVSAWASEEKDYLYDTNTCRSGRVCGHYTQIVWRSTRRVGCARVVCDDGNVFMTCNYDPPGNVVGERPY